MKGYIYCECFVCAVLASVVVDMENVSLLGPHFLPPFLFDGHATSTLDLQLHQILRCDVGDDDR